MLFQSRRVGNSMPMLYYIYFSLVTVQFICIWFSDLAALSKTRKNKAKKYSISEEEQPLLCSQEHPDTFHVVGITDYVYHV